MSAKRLSPARRRALQWIADRQPVGWFDASGPSLQFVRRLKKDGDVEPAGREPGAGIIRVTLYRLTSQGRDKLAGVRS